MTVQVRDFYRMSKTYVSNHPEITVIAPNGEPVRMDVFIADLCIDLWDAGVPTVASCGGEPGAEKHHGAYIMFGKVEHLVLAMPIIRQHRPGMPEAAERELAEWLSTPCPESEDEDFYDYLLFGGSPEWEVIRRPSETSCAIYFPHDHVHKR